MEAATSRAAGRPIGPLHRLIHAQLVLASQREAWIADAAAAGLGPDAIGDVAAARRAHPLDVVDRTLEELVDASGPHASLEALVSRCHRREGAVYAALVNRHGDAAEVRLRLAAWEHGLDVGRRIAEGRHAVGPGDALDLVSEHVLEDMPCRSGVTVLLEEASRVAWKHDECPYRRDWERVRAPMSTACNVVSAWMRGLVCGMGEDLEYRRPKALALGDTRCEHEIIQIER